MRELPILFSGPMVRAILDGRKTQTRRLVKAPRWMQARGADVNAASTFCDPGVGDGEYEYLHVAIPEDDTVHRVHCPYGVPGDRLWVRETWGLVRPVDPTDWSTGSIRGRTADELLEEWVVAYRADSATRPDGAYWRPPMFMPRWASRLTLEITGIRVERVRDISEDDARTEGVAPEWRQATHPEKTARAAFLDMFFSINGRAPKDTNPWVWVVEFKQAVEGGK